MQNYRWIVPLAALALFACEEEPAAESDAGTDVGVDTTDDVDPGDTSDDIDPDTLGDTNEPDPDVIEDTDADEDTTPDDGVTWGARFDPASDAFFAMPWPLDTRVDATGHIDLSGFPNSTSGQVAEFTKTVERHVVGFSPMSAVYFEFDRTPSTDALVPTPAGSLEATSPIQLVRVDGDTCTEHVPVISDFDLDGDSGRNTYAFPNTLRFAPAEGFPMATGETYAAIVTRDFGAEAGREATPNPRFAAALAGTDEDDGLNAVYAPLRACLPSLGLSTDDIAIATVFTVGEPAAQLERFYNYVRSSDELPDPSLTDLALNDTYTGRWSIDRAFSGHYDTPIFQVGESPYATEGGEFAENEGRPLVQRWESVPFIILLPEGEGPFPVLVWEDGTGWGEWGQAGDDHIDAMLDAGVAVASFMPQFHGTRAVPRSDAELHTYNFQNPEAGRTVLRQEALDIAYFIRVLEGPLSARAEFALDTDHMVYGGHSQGTQPGGMVAAFSDDFQAYMLSGASAYFAVTVLERKDLVDYEELFALLLGVTSDLDLFHPALQVLQLGADAVDPYVYATQWSGSASNPDGNNVFVINGFHDETTHPLGMAHLTIAGDLQPIEDEGWDMDRFDIWSTEAVPPPIAGNRTADSGRSLTHATYLNSGTGHFTLYQRDRPVQLSVDFWLEALDGEVPSLTYR